MKIFIFFIIVLIIIVSTIARLGANYNFKNKIICHGRGSENFLKLQKLNKSFVEIKKKLDCFHFQEFIINYIKWNLLLMS